MAGVAGELHDGADVVGQVGGGEVPILNVGLVAVAFLKGWGEGAQGTAAQMSPGRLPGCLSAEGPFLTFGDAPRKTGTRPCDLGPVAIHLAS